MSQRLSQLFEGDPLANALNQCYPQVESFYCTLNLCVIIKLAPLDFGKWVPCLYCNASSFVFTGCVLPNLGKIKDSCLCRSFFLRLSPSIIISLPFSKGGCLCDHLCSGLIYCANTADEPQKSCGQDNKTYESNIQDLALLSLKT